MDSADASGAADAAYGGGGDDAVVADAESLVPEDREEVRFVEKAEGRPGNRTTFYGA